MARATGSVVHCMFYVFLFHTFKKIIDVVQIASQ